MFRTTAFAAALITAMPAAAAQEDTQFWLSGGAEIPVAGELSLALETSQRFRSPATGDDQQLLRAGLQWDAADWITLGGNFTYVEGATDETRLAQSVTFHAGPLNLRSQLEERFFEGAERVQLRVRQRVQLVLPLDDNDRLLPFVELNYILQHQDPMQEDRVDHWRVRMDWRHRVSERLELSAAYMALLAPRAVAKDRLSHVPSLSLAYSF